ncbi:MAG: heterodisulfide reductase-related iron-sulfur binding cluster [Candidatus Thorarchaeota archaeon]
MPYENCDSCKKCLPCPVTSGDKNQGAYPIAQNKGDNWYCSNCFYCEDICPDYSPRQYAIDKRRATDQNNPRMIKPLEEIRKHGQLFEINPALNNYREDHGLPNCLSPNLQDINSLFDLVSTFQPNMLENSQIISSENKITIKSENDKVALFLGCLIPYRVFEYEYSARNILKKIEVNFVDLPFACCGSIMTESQSEILWLVLGAYNLALAEEQNIFTVITLCGGCCGNLRRVNDFLKDKSKLQLVNSYLARINKKYTGQVKVQHLTEYLYENNFPQKIRQKQSIENIRKLEKLQFGIQIPCQIVRPKEHSPYADLETKLISSLIDFLPITIIHYPFDTLCCGSTMLQYDEKLSYKIAKKRILSLQKNNADALIIGCGNCSMNYKIHQNEYSQEKLQIIFFTEILDFALGSENNDIELMIKRKKKIRENNLLW